MRLRCRRATGLRCACLFHPLSFESLNRTTHAGQSQLLPRIGSPTPSHPPFHVHPSPCRCPPFRWEMTTLTTRQTHLLANRLLDRITDHPGSQKFPSWRTGTMTWMVTSLYPDQAWDSSDDEDGLDFADREDKTITACPFFPFLLEANRPRIPPWLISLYVPGASALAMLSPSPPAQRERRRLRKSHVHSTTTLTDKRSGAGDKSRSEQYQRDGSKGDSPSFHITNDCSQYLTVIRRTPAGARVFGDTIA